MGPLSVVRWVRAASFAATCAGLAALGHLAGGGRFDPAASLSGFLLLLLPALALTGRERALSRILPATALSQVVLHVLLTQSAGRQATAAAERVPGMDAMAHMEAMARMEPSAYLEHLAHMEHMSRLDDAGSLSFGMLLMHAAGVLVSSVWLRWVEAGLCALVRQLAGWVLRPLLVLFFLAAGWAAGGPRAIAHAAEDQIAPIRLLLRYALVRRGPPGGHAGTAVAT